MSRQTSDYEQRQYSGGGYSIANPRRVLVTLPEGIWKLMRNDLRGKIGDGDSEIIRNIVLTFLTEKGFFAPAKVQPPIQDEKLLKSFEDLKWKVDVHEAMIWALAEILEDKKLTTGLEL